MKTILLTGGAGFIGSHLADMYLADGFQVVIVDDLSTGLEKNLPDRCIFYQMDICAPELEDLFERYRPEIVNHHAAHINVRRSMAEPQSDARVNILGLLNVLKCCTMGDTRHFIFASSGGAIYGDHVEIPTPEAAVPFPVSPYGIAKLAGEHYVTCLAKNYGLSTSILRYGNIYGPRQNPLGEAGVVSIFYDKLMSGETPRINGDGTQTRDYVYVGDVVEINRFAGSGIITGICNVGTGVETDVNRLAQLILSTLGRENDVLPHGPAMPGEQQRSVLRTDRIPAVLGENWHWTSLKEGLALTLDYYRSAR